ncbi:MAG: adenylate/guanylate cyclase domain-containing protein [Candidatus Velthaea sp.]
MSPLAVAAGILLLAAIVGLSLTLRRYGEQRLEVDRVRSLFSRYVAPPIVEELLRRKDARLYTGRSMHATVLVCRIWNFPGFAEALTPEETLRYLNEFFVLAGTSIQKHRGMIDKFLSDGIIGVFGVPLEDTFQEEHALRAALDIVRLVDAMDKRWHAQGRRSIQVGIGINSGDVIAGDAGFNERREFTVVGPETLFAERLQEATIDLNAFIVASAATCDVVRDVFTLVPIKGHPLRGMKRLADAFIVRGLRRGGRDTLTLPERDAFAETRIEAPPPAPPAPAPKTVAAPAPFERTESARARAEDLPELRIARFAANDDEPILPDPPPPRATYEDAGGPPIQLPP